MPEITQHTPGSFCWAELATTDQSAAKNFYQSLFGWEANDAPMEGGTVYSMMHIKGKNVGAMYRMQKEVEAHGVPPHWMPYVSVVSADETVDNAKRLGATIVAGPFDVYDAGRMAVIRDPAGAMISIWQPKTHKGADLIDDIGAMCWAELQTNDLAGSKKFYTSLFGWTVKDDPQYAEYALNGKPHAGMMSIPAEWGDVPPTWSIYFRVANCDSTVGKATSAGASALVPPMDIPAVGRFSVLRDPQGAVFNVFTPTS